MAEAARRSSGNTTLMVAGMTAEIGLFKTQADPASELRFDTAGPNGRVLRVVKRAVAKPEEEVPVETVPVAPGSSDPLADREQEMRGIGQTAERMADSIASAPEGEFRQVLIEEGTGDDDDAPVVEPEDVRRGVRLEDGRFIDCTDQLDAIVSRTKLDRMDVVACIDSRIIRRERVVGSYFIGSQDDASAPVLRVLYEALRARREVAIVKYTTRSRQQLGVVSPHARSGTLVLLSLMWSADVREAPAKATMIQGVEVKAQHVTAMGQILESMHSTVETLDELSDDALRLREELHTRAVNGELDVMVVEPLPSAEELPGLDEALQQALAAAQAA